MPEGAERAQLLLPIAAIGIGEAGTIAAPGGSGNVTDVRVDNGRLSVRIEGARLIDVLRIIGRQGGFRVKFLGGADGRPVSHLTKEFGALRVATRQLSCTSHQTAGQGPS